MTTPRMITAAWLKENNACADEYDLFCKEWPGGCEATHDNLLRAAAIGLNLEWFAWRVLPPQVCDDYEAQRAALFADYESCRAPLLADWSGKHAALCADYESSRDVLMHADFEAKDTALHADFLAKRDALEAGYLGKCAPLYSDCEDKCHALIIPFLLNHFAALPASNAAGGN